MLEIGMYCFVEISHMCIYKELERFIWWEKFQQLDSEVNLFQNVDPKTLWEQT